LLKQPGVALISIAGWLLVVGFSSFTFFSSDFFFVIASCALVVIPCIFSSGLLTPLPFGFCCVLHQYLPANRRSLTYRLPVQQSLKYRLSQHLLQTLLFTFHFSNHFISSTYSPSFLFHFNKVTSLMDSPTV
jgi:hypothetical protein